jgi:hypothetical protein
MENAPQERQNWIEKIIDSFFSHKREGGPTGTPQEMIDEAGRKAFKISTALGLIPGPLGMAVVLPEIAAVTRLQINLIHRIAAHHRKQEQISRELILLILGNALGVAAGESLVRRVGSALVIKSVNTRVIRGISRTIGTRIIDTAAEKAMGRWIPMITAPLFGYLSRSLTRKVGKEANRLFSQEIVREILPGLTHSPPVTSHSSRSSRPSPPVSSAE